MYQMMKTRSELPEHRQNHIRAVEACLSCYEHSVEQLHTEENHLANMREESVKIARRKMTPARKSAIQTHKKEREQYWQDHVTPVIHTMQEQLDRLKIQLELTHMHYPDLANEGCKTLLEMTDKTALIDDIPKKSVIRLMNCIKEKLRTTLESNKEMLPEITSIICLIRLNLDRMILQNRYGVAMT